MRKLRKNLSQAVPQLTNAASLPDASDFDEDYRKVLQIFHLTGFLRSESSKSSPFVSFLLLSLMMALGTAKNTICFIIDGNAFNASIYAALLSLFIVYTVQIVTFIMNQEDIKELIKALQKLHEPENEIEVEKNRKFLSLILKVYISAMLTAIFAMNILKIFGSHFSKLIIPTIYDILADGNLYWPLAIAAEFQTFGVAFSSIACEIIHILCMVRIEANLNFLAVEIRKCTNDDEKSEIALISCVRYHCRIKR